jgi:dihydrofolate synthase/folylpolyglutamate synthase
MLDAMVRASGYVCGLYTSPHLVSITERIRINGVPVGDDELACLVAAIDEAAERCGIVPPFFDVLTCAAFCYFDRRRCDIVIIETGLGGRRDSTNVFTPLCSIITEISLDHLEVLGNTIPDIAHEKAGIVKRGVPVLCCSSDPEALSVIALEARRAAAPMMTYSQEYGAAAIESSPPGHRFSFYVTGSLRVDDVRITQGGVHQVKNAATALAAAFLLQPAFPRLRPAELALTLAGVVVPGAWKPCRRPRRSSSILRIILRQSAP